MCMFCRSLFVLLYFWPLCCLSFFDLRILITLLVSSNSSPLIKSVSFSIYKAHIYILSSCMLRMRSVLSNIPWCIIFILLFYSGGRRANKMAWIHLNTWIPIFVVSWKNVFSWIKTFVCPCYRQYMRIWWYIFIEFLISWFGPIRYEILQNLYTTYNNKFTIYINIAIQVSRTGIRRCGALLFSVNPAVCCCMYLNSQE